MRIPEDSAIGSEVFTVLAYPRQQLNMQALDGVSWGCKRKWTRRGRLEKTESMTAKAVFREPPRGTISLPPSLLFVLPAEREMTGAEQRNCNAVAKIKLMSEWIARES